MDSTMEGMLDTYLLETESSVSCTPLKVPVP